MNIVTRLVTMVSLGGIAMAVSIPAAANEKLPAPVYKAKYDAKRDMYCLTPTGSDAQRTGTRVPLVECKTDRQWAVEGLNVARR